MDQQERARLAKLVAQREETLRIARQQQASVVARRTQESLDRMNRKLGR